MSYDNRSQAWGNALGAYLKSRAVFGVPVTVHNPLESFTAVNPSFYTLLRDWPVPWADYMLRQIQVGALGGVSELSDDVPEKGRPGIARGAGEAVFPRFFNPRSFAHQNQLMIDLRRFGIPVVNEEPGYEKKATPGSYTGIDPKSWNFQTSESLLSTFWTAALAGGYNMWGSLETYSLDDPLPGLQNSVTPQYIRILHDFMTRLPYWEMAPANEVVSPFEIEIEGKPWRSNFCMAKAAEIYVVFSEYGGEGTMSLPQGSYRVTRLNPRIGLETDLGAASGGKQPFKLPLGEWVLLYRREA
jgi:hypothetical protein